EDGTDVTLPPRKKLGIALGPGYEVGESSSAAAARPAGGQMTKIRELHVDDRRRQTVISELLRAEHRRSTEIIELRTTLQGQVTALQGQVIALQAQVTALQGQQGLAGGPTEPELPKEAVDQETVNTTSVTNAQLQAMINQGVTAALAARDALRITNGDDSHNSRTCVRRTERATLASKPKMMQEAVENATELMDKKIRTFTERETASKRKFKNTSRNTQNQQ
nr:hypothetical protein [Tanacetum cinerariifolium]